MNRRVHDLFFGRFFHREFLDHAPLPRDQHAIREIHDFGQIGRDHHDGEAGIGQRIDHLMQFGDGADVDAACRLVEDDQLRLLHQRAGDDDLLLVAAGQFDHACIAVDRLDVQLAGPLFRQFDHLGIADDHAVLVEVRRQQVEIDVLGDRLGFKEALDLAVLGDVDDAVLDRLARHPVAHRAAFQLHLAAMEEVALHHTGNDLRGFGAARADQAEDTGDLAAVDRKRGVADHAAHRQVLDAENLLPVGARYAFLCILAVEFAGQRAADHGIDDLVAVEILGEIGDDVLAVAQHGDAIRDRQRFFQRVRNEDDGDAVLLQAADQREEVMLLLWRQGRGWLVEDDDLGLVVHRTGDFHHLLLRRAELRHEHGRIDAEVQRLQKLLRRDVDAAQAVEKLLVAEIEVLPHRHRWHQAGLLEHHGDSFGLGLHRVAELHIFAIESHFAVGWLDHAGHDLGQRGLSGTVFAA